MTGNALARTSPQSNRAGHPNLWSNFGSSELFDLCCGTPLAGLPFEILSVQHPTKSAIQGKILWVHRPTLALTIRTLGPVTNWSRPPRLPVNNRIRQIRRKAPCMRAHLQVRLEKFRMTTDIRTTMTEEAQALASLKHSFQGTKRTTHVETPQLLRDPGVRKRE